MRREKSSLHSRIMPNKTSSLHIFDTNGNYKITTFDNIKHSCMENHWEFVHIFHYNNDIKVQRCGRTAGFHGSVTT